MKPTTIALFFAGIFLLLSYSMRKKAPDSLLKIPAQSLNLLQLVGDTLTGKEQDIAAFEISKQVTFREYKQYLATIKKSCLSIACPNVRNGSQQNITSKQTNWKAISVKTIPTGCSAPKMNHFGISETTHGDNGRMITPISTKQMIRQ